MPDLPTAPTVHELACPACRYIAWRPRVAACGHTVCGQCCDLGLEFCPVCDTHAPAWYINRTLFSEIGSHLDVSSTLQHRRASRTDELVKLCLCKRPRVRILKSTLDPAATLAALRALRRGHDPAWSEAAGSQASLVVCVADKLMAYRAEA